MRKYVSFFRIRFINALQYRAAALAGMATQFFWGGMLLLMFAAFYRSAPENFPMGFQELSSYIWLQQAFLAMLNAWSFENDIFEAVSTGNIAYELCRPMGLYSQWFLKASANRMARAALRCVPVLVFASILPAPYGIILPPDAGTALLFVFSLFLALGVIVAFTMVIYIITFYTISPTGVRMAAVSAADLLSGSLLPLPFFPDGFRQAVELLPFASMQNVPLRVYSGDLSGQAAAWAIGLQLFWFAALLVLGMWMMRRALHRVVVQGG
ncbi:MAG TPA: ABC transporter permease [Candidatus Gallacutalibacter pullistercoris]|nr:ABC transporter permease [Candidatus Gallacutalibacter pullistercoris]